MNATLHELFKNIVQEYGEEAMTKSTFIGLLLDYGGQDVQKYHHILTKCLNYRLAEKLTELRELNISSLKARTQSMRGAFINDCMFRYDVANYIFDCYLYALSIIDEEDIHLFDENANYNGNAKVGELSFVDFGSTAYCGTYNEEKKRSGFGLEKDDNGICYLGEWKLDSRHGMGVEINSTREKYAGEWRLHCKNGVGISIDEDGIKYVGEWKNGKREGLGLLIFPNNDKTLARFYKGQIDQIIRQNK